MPNKLSIFFAALASFMLSSCGQGDVLFVEQAVINLSPIEDNPSAGYLKINGGPIDVDLVGVTADDVRRVEMHETVEVDGVSRMNSLTKVPVPAGETILFEPGGKHLMIWGVGRGSIRQGKLVMTFIFSNDDRLLVEADIQGMGSNAADIEAAEDDSANSGSDNGTEAE